MVADPLVTQSYSLTQEQIDWLRARGERDSRRGASSALRQILDDEMAAYREAERKVARVG